jgi:hypothetical protein
MNTHVRVDLFWFILGLPLWCYKLIADVAE